VAVAPAEEEGAPQKIFGVLKVNKFKTKYRFVEMTK